MDQKKPDHAGHRSRMHERVRLYGFNSLEEHEALEYLLYFTNARRDTNLIAHALIDRFGSLAGVLEASEEELCKVKGVGPKTARLLHLLPEAGRYYMRSRVGGRRQMETAAQMGEYLVAQFYGLRQERMLMLALNDRRTLLRAIWLDSGTVSAVDVGIHRIVTEAVAAGASAVVLAHNHPGGVALPSREDIYATGSIMRALGMLGIHVADHIIVAGEDYCSMQEDGRLPFYNFSTGELVYCTKG